MHNSYDATHLVVSCSWPAGPSYGISPDGRLAPDRVALPIGIGTSKAPIFSTTAVGWWYEWIVKGVEPLDAVSSTPDRIGFGALNRRPEPVLRVSEVLTGL